MAERNENIELNADYDTRKDVRDILPIGLYDTPEDELIKSSKITELENIIRDWVKIEAKEKLFKKSSPSDEEYSYGTRVLIFGSLAFNISVKDGDVDAVCLLPNFIQRVDVFDKLFKVLSAKENISEIRKITEAYNPIISLIFSDIKIDLSFCIFPRKRIPEDLDFDNTAVLRGLDELSIRSLSGLRDAMAFSALVPDMNVFTNTLKVIKAWANTKRVSNAAMGYPGGIAWAVLVAHTCQLYPAAPLGEMVKYVFSVFSAWHWPRPVMLRPLEDPPSSDHHLQQYNPETMRHIMPIITPSYPEHNCAYTVSVSSKNVVSVLLQEGHRLCGLIEQGQESWECIFKPIDFFSLYKHFIMISAVAFTEANFDWTMYLASQVRKLVVGLESVQEIKKLHLYARTFRHKQSNECHWFVGLQLQKIDGKTQNSDISAVVKTFKETVFNGARERQFRLDDAKLDIKHLPRKRLEEIRKDFDET